MTKRERPGSDRLNRLMAEFEVSKDPRPIRDHLQLQSKLPGPRANLELARDFAEIVGRCSEGRPGQYWNLCTSLAMISGKDAPANNPKEFLVFCGIQGVASIGARRERYLIESMEILRKASRDERWRIREAVAMGLQNMVATNRKLLSVLGTWAASGDYLEMRAVAAAMGEPSLMKDKRLVEVALELHKVIIDNLKSPDRNSDEFRSLRQTLGYSISVVAPGNPEKAFGYLQSLLKKRDPDLTWIVRENLRKKRLTTERLSRELSG